MGGSRGLTEKQSAVLDDIFGGELGEVEVLAKHKLSRRIYNKWLSEERFREEFDSRIEWAYRQSEALIARYAPLAAAKLVQLTESANQETARKACIDIISLPKQAAKKDRPREKKGETKKRQLSPAIASKLLAAMAETKRQPACGEAG